MNPETYFLRYAFPCIFIKKLRGEITDLEIKELENAALENKPANRQKLESIFRVASEQLDKISQELGKEKWSIEVIKEYFLMRHNPFVDTRPNLPGNTLKDLCKIHEAKVIEDKGSIVQVIYGNKTRNVSKDFFPNVKAGDSVRIHYAYIVETL